MQHFYGMDFVSAVKHLLNGEEGAEFVQASNTPEPKPEFKMPELSKNMHRTFAYLIKTRRIDADVVQHFVNEKKIFETAEHHNAAFCGYDETGEMKQMHLRSTQSNRRFFLDVAGSDKQYYFRTTAWITRSMCSKHRWTCCRTSRYTKKIGSSTAMSVSVVWRWMH